MTKLGRVAFLALLLPACGGIVGTEADVADGDATIDHGGGDVDRDVPADDAGRDGEIATDAGDGEVAADAGDGSDVPAECTTAAQCADGNPCNGIEACDAGRCVPGPAPGDGTACDTGNPCLLDGSCAGGRCGGTPLACDDGDDCTIDACDAATLPPADPCQHVPLPLWYRDGDHDTYGDRASVVCSNVLPGPEYVERDGDCCDSLPGVHQDEAEYQATPYVCGAGGTHSFDYNCNGTADPESTTVAGGCVGAGCPSCSCSPGWCPEGWISNGGACTGVPGCGGSGLWVTGCTVFDPTTDGGTSDSGTSDGGTTESGTGDGGATETVGPDGGAGDVLDGSTDGAPTCVPVVVSRVQRCR